MNREQWQQKRVHAGVKRTSTAPDAAEIARRVQATAHVSDTAKPAVESGSQPEAEKSATAERRPRRP